MGFRQTTNDQHSEGSDTTRRRSTPSKQSGPSHTQRGGAFAPMGTERAEEYFGLSIPDRRTVQRLQMHEETYGKPQVAEWVAEGMPTEIMGKTRDMEAFRGRQADRPPELPTDIERQNEQSVQRSEKAATRTDSAGETSVPEPVRDVIASTGRSLDSTIQRAMEDRMDESFSEVRIHTDATAAAACESINARAFTVGNHIAFNHGEYDPGSPDGQHVLAHELAHVRQQTGGAVSLLPQEDVELKVDPDPAAEREAEETAQQVMAGWKLDIQRMRLTDVHVQRLPGFGREDVDIETQQESAGVATEMLKAAGKETGKRLVPNEIFAALDAARENTQDGPPAELVDTVADEVMNRINDQTELDLSTTAEDSGELT